jgi:hypothetical protein
MPLIKGKAKQAFGTRRAWTAILDVRMAIQQSQLPM